MRSRTRGKILAGALAVLTAAVPVIGGCGSSSPGALGSKVTGSVTGRAPVREDDKSKDIMPEISAEENKEETAAMEEPLADKTVTKEGPYGSVTVTVPGNWTAEPYYVEVDYASGCQYGVAVCPAGEESPVEIGYEGGVGLCGTGLSQEKVTLAGDEALICTYDDLEGWSLILYLGRNEGLTAQAYADAGWVGREEETLTGILDSVVFDQSRMSGCVSYFVSDAEWPEKGMMLTLKDVTPRGARATLSSYDKNADVSQIQCGSDYRMEKKTEDGWEPLEPVIENWAFTAEAYLIETGGNRTFPMDWTWLYGELAPGTYRFGKSVIDWRAPGDYDEKTLFAEFLIR